MRRTDVEAMGEVAGEALAATGNFVKTMHEGIAGRPFGILGPFAKPVRVVHDGVSSRIYGGVATGLRRASQRGAETIARRAGDEGASFAATPAGALALGALNGMYGNHLVDRRNALAVGMDVRRHGRNIDVDRPGLTAAFPDATSRIAVFVHGLFGDDECWRMFPLRGREGRRTYGERLQDELSITPVHVRYNTGLRISENGRALARLLDDLLAAWPVPVEDVVLIGHSMGGLVVRSACHYGGEESRRWTDSVRHVFCLGSPHLGADLEKGVNVLGWAAAKLPETRAFAKVLNARSVGIKDLRYGSCVEADWCECEDPDEFLRDRCTEVPFLPDASYYFIGANLIEGPLGSLLGDLLVRTPSASGRGNGKGRRIAFEVDNGKEFTGMHHMHLLNHPAVYDQLHTWITRAPATRRELAAAG